MNPLTAYLGYTAGALLAILPIVNPLGAVPLVMTVAAHLPEAERQRQIRRACIYTFALMTGFLVAGSLIMNFFGISIPGMRIAGGMIVAFLGFRMLFPSDTLASEVAMAGEPKYDIAFTPLAMPGLSGPGTFAVVMSLGSQASARTGWDRAFDYLGVATGILLVALLSWLTLRAAERFNRLLGATGMVAMTRLMGFLMICIGVQFIINGLIAISADPQMWAGLAEAVRQTHHPATPR
jgi:multiple antibiotic resistance protein